MSSIFGDSDEITFGNSEPVSSKRPVLSQEKASPSLITTDKVPLRPSFPKKEYKTPLRKEVSQNFQAVSGTQKPSLIRLIDSMKPSFLPLSEGTMIRFISLSSVDVIDPMFLVRTGESSLLFGTGFSEIQNAGTAYVTFPDMRLISHEKERLAGWILTSLVTHIRPFKMILEALGFPHVYASRDIIANIRERITDLDFLEKCRFFELFTFGSDERKVGEFLLQNTTSGLQIKNIGNGITFGHTPIDSTALDESSSPLLTKDSSGYHFPSLDISFISGEILEIAGKSITKHHLKFTFDTFYIDKESVGVVAGYALKDRTDLANNGVLTFVLEEDRAARSILGHIFIDSRGFVHSYEMMSVHKSILSGIRKIYEEEIIKNPRLERAELVHTLRREVTKYCFLLTGRTPVVMPVILER